MAEAVTGFEIGDEERDRLWTAISTVRDASPRQPDDAATDDIVDALLPELGRIMEQRITDRGAAPSTAWHDAGLEVWNAWTRFGDARTPIQQATAVVDLGNAMSQLATFLPGYDYNTGTVVDPDGE